MHALVERQRQYIGSMRASNFWKLRDRVFQLLHRLGVRADPLPVPSLDDLRVESVAFADPYQVFRAAHATRADELGIVRSLTALLDVPDAFDIVIDARQHAADQLETTMASLRSQVYPRWQAHVIGHDGDVPAPSGAFVAALVAGDVLEAEALLAVFLRFAEGADVVYTDHDVFDPGGIPADPNFKPDWSPETILTRDYVGRLCVFRATTIAACGGIDWRSPVPVYDALLRASEITDRIVHVPHVLVHVAPGEATAAKKAARLAAVRGALERRGERALLVATDDGIDVRFEAPGTERIAIIVPTRDRSDLLERCLSSLFARTQYPDFHVIVVDNGSREDATRSLLDAWIQREPQRFRVLRDEQPFNFSRLNNRAVEATDAPFVVLLNNDTEVITEDWLSAMLGQARRPPIGAVGALLLFEDGTIQHAGVVLGGVLGLAGHAYRLLDLGQTPARAALALDTNYLAVTGACLMVERSKYQRVGGLDESLAVAYNDIDFCAKLHEAGYRNVVVPHARLFHYESKTRGADDTAAKRERGLRESDAFRRRWPHWVERDPYYNPNLTLRAEDFSVKR